MVEEGVSAYPQAVTGQMLHNFVAGGAALSVLARRLGAVLEVMDLGTVEPLELAGVTHLRLGPGTANFTREPAMSEAQLDQALAAGGAASRAQRRMACSCSSAAMGIGNTSSASALAAVLLPRSPLTLVGPGTGLMYPAFDTRNRSSRAPCGCMPGIAACRWKPCAGLAASKWVALTGAYRACSAGYPGAGGRLHLQRRALCAVRLNPACRAWLLFAHRSAEPGHLAVLEALEAAPLLDLGLRLGRAAVRRWRYRCFSRRAHCTTRWPPSPRRRWRTGMSTRIDLLRHGETERGGGFRGSLDDALTAHGWQQMRDAVALAGPWDVLVSSPLQRCAAFARELAAERRLPLRIEPELRELHFGAWEGRSAAELMSTDAEALGRFWADPYGFTPPGGEPLLRFEARVLAAIERVRLHFAGRRVLVIGHAG